MERKVNKCWQRIFKRTDSFVRYLLRQNNTNRVYDIKVELNMWMGLILLRVFFIEGL
jgi:hypothetical protein